MNLKIGLLAFSILGLGFSAEAMAQTAPWACQTAPNLSSYEAGVASGRALTRQAWVGVNRSCVQLERFTSVLINTVERLMVPPGSDDFVACRHAGIVAGVYEEVNAVWDSCAVQSCTVGHFVGRLAGKLVCDIATGMGPTHVRRFLPPPPTAFPALSQICCENAFLAEIDRCLPGSTFPWDQIGQHVCAPTPP